MASDYVSRICKFDGMNFAFWRMQIEDYLYSKKWHHSNMKEKSKAMKDDEWTLVAHQVFGVTN